eukprot:2370555-Rhodomonas_salina.1
MGVEFDAGVNITVVEVNGVKGDHKTRPSSNVRVELRKCKSSPPMSVQISRPVAPGCCNVEAAKSNVGSDVPSSRKARAL